MLNLYRLERQIEEELAAQQVPGLALAIVQGGEVAYANGLGVTSAEDGGVAVTPQTLFRIGSTTKPLTGTAVMRLVERGLLDLDRSITAYVPWLRFSEEGVSERVTLRMLLSHTAGLPREQITPRLLFGRRDPAGLEAYAREELPRLPLVAPPGMVWSYSNPGINLAGCLAEMISGRPYAALMQEEVFAPLAMGRTTFDPTVAMTYPLAQAHELADDGALRVQRPFADNTGHYPAGFAFSTVLDLANFAIMHLGGGHFQGRQILREESVAVMRAAQVDRYMLNKAGYGLTWMVEDYKGVRRVSHAGGISTFGCKFAFAPGTGVGVVLLFNRLGNFERTSQGIVDTVFDALLGLPETSPEPQTVEPDRSRWAGYCGEYRGTFVGAVMVRIDGERLVLERDGAVIPLESIGPNLYGGHRPGDRGQVSVGFVPGTAGSPEFMMVDGWPYRREGK